MNQKGRSMVEMLGVLAIIGVLSAGGLAGYSKAMFRHRVNQTIDIFQGVLQRFAELEGKDLGDNFELCGSEDMIKYGLMPNCEEAVGDYNSVKGCKLPIGVLDACFGTENSILHGEFEITLTDSKSCVAFLSAKWENVIQPDWITENNSGLFGMTGADFYAPGWSNSDEADVSMNNIINGCQACDEREKCMIELAIRGEY